MSAISQYCHPNEQGWQTYQIDKLDTPEMCQIVADDCTFSARTEKLKVGGAFLLAGTASFASIFVAAAAAKISLFAFAVGLFPLLIAPPLYFIGVMAGGLAVGAKVGHECLKETWSRQSEHFQYHNGLADHLYAQALEASLRKAHLEGACK